jgi:hypothetical protein
MRAGPIALSVLLLGLGSTLLFCAPARSQRGPGPHYVDFEHGDDSRDGRTPASAWRHAPGDPEAKGAPARWTLGPGDRILFAPGVRYRGSIVLNGSGSADAPIEFASAPGPQPAIIDGGDAATVTRACRSAEECGGVSNWRQLTRIEFAAAAPAQAALFSQAGVLTPAQDPNVPDPFYYDEVSNFLPAPGSALAEGRAPLPAGLIERISPPGERQIAVWVRGNQVQLRPITGFASGAALFDPTGLSFYTDRDDRVAVIGHPALVDRPGEYAFIEGRRAAVALLPEGANAVSIAAGRGGIDLHGASHVVVRGLAFENMMGLVGDIRTGVPIQNAMFKGEDLRIENNRFSRLWMGNGQGAITIRGVHGLRIEGNTIDTVAIGSGMRLAKLSDVTVVGNKVSRVGRTGIMLMSVVGADVRDNTIRDVQGVHGNGLSVYLDNQDIRIIGNTIIGSTRPATFHGGDKVSDNGLVFACNLFVGNAGSEAALQSWSSDHPMSRVTIERNVLLGGKMGARLSAADRDVTVKGNISNGINTRGEQGADWKLSENRSVTADLGGPLDKLEGMRRQACGEHPGS